MPALVSFLHYQEYGAGRMLTGEVKQRLIQVLTEIVERHRNARAAVTEEVWFWHLLQSLVSTTLDCGT